jgi:23S rRNA pseudouridine1911/1915/1917 synthase
MPALEVLYEDNHLLAVNKPAGIPTMGTPGDRPTLLSVAKEYVKQKYQKPGNVYLGVMSRLDAPVTGVVLLARTSKAARRLTEQFRTHTVEKTYWALVEGEVEPETGTYVDWLGQDERHRRMHIVGRTLPGAKEAKLSYRRLAMVSEEAMEGRGVCFRRGRRASGARQALPRGISLVEVQLLTGRKHQIRLQFSHHGHPVVGDQKYGSGHAFPAGIALHARRLTVVHPVRNQPTTFDAPLPASWPAISSLPSRR